MKEIPSQDFEMDQNEPISLEDYLIKVIDDKNRNIVLLANKKTYKYGIYDIFKKDWVKSGGKESITYNDDFDETNFRIRNGYKNVKFSSEFTNSIGDKFYVVFSSFKIRGIDAGIFMSEKDYIDAHTDRMDRKQHSTYDNDKVYEEQNPINEAKMVMLNTFKRLIK